jgi:thiol-disulfide isomerase/thioredoxin
MKKHLWIPLVVFLLIPVPVAMLRKAEHTPSGIRGPLLTGIESLDSLLAEADGRPVLINFWATWCAPCVRELPVLDQVHIQMGEEAVFVAVSIGDPNLATLEAFREMNSVSMPMVWLSVQDAGLVSRRYALPDVLPVTLILGPEGTESARAVGVRSGEWFTDALLGVLPENTGDPPSDDYIHVFVVGSSSHPATAELIAAAIDIAGEDGVDFLDPRVPEDSVAIEDLYLPVLDHPYAQLCVGPACSPPVSTADELYRSHESMR